MQLPGDPHQSPLGDERDHPVSCRVCALRPTMAIDAKCAACRKDRWVANRAGLLAAA